MEVTVKVIATGDGVQYDDYWTVTVRVTVTVTLRATAEMMTKRKLIQIQTVNVIPIQIPTLKVMMTVNQRVIRRATQKLIYRKMKRIKVTVKVIVTRRVTMEQKTTTKVMETVTPKMMETVTQRMTMDQMLMKHPMK